MAKTNDRDRYQFGICTNRNKGNEEIQCPKCESREVQKTRIGQDFVCEECKEPLRRVAPPKEGVSIKLIMAVTGSVVVIAGIVWVVLTQYGNDKNTGDDSNTEEVTVVLPAETVSEPPAQAPYTVIDRGDQEKGTGTGSISFDYGKYEGEIKNFKANGQGRLKYFKSHRLSQGDKQNRNAESGDVFDGSFVDNEPANGKWFDKEGNQKGVLLIGQTGNREE